MRPSTLVAQLEAAILDDPDDRAAHAALADFLMEQADPASAARGEFIRVQLALEDEALPAGERAQLRQREAELLHARRAEWAGEWAELVEAEGPEGRSQVDFAIRDAGFVRGILAQACLRELSVECARAFVRAPQTRLVRELYVGGWQYEEEGNEPAPELDESPVEDEYPVDREYPSQYALARWPHFANLRVFQSGWTSDEDYGDHCDFQCHLRGDLVAHLVSRMPRLEELYLFADSVATDTLFSLATLTRLRVLQVYHCWEYPLELLAGNPALARLTHLLLHPKANGAWDNTPAPYIRRDGVRALLRSPHLGSLRHLRLRLTDLGDGGCEEFVASGALRRLKTLDLRHGCITDDGARTLARCPDLANLEHLDVSRNRLTEAGVAALRAAIPGVSAEYQQETEGDREEYLFQGDYE